MAIDMLTLNAELVKLNFAARVRSSVVADALQHVPSATAVPMVPLAVRHKKEKKK